MTYPPVGRCIYCTADRYDLIIKKLTAEHIVPLALNGVHVLPEAVCKKCQRITHKPEESILHFSAKGFRTRHQYRSRRPQPRELPLYNINGTGKKIMVPVEDYPHEFGIPICTLPSILSPTNTPSDGTNKVWVHMDNADEIAWKLSAKGIREWEGPRTEGAMLFRMYAKIAHSYAVAERGIDGFHPLLLDVILKGFDQKGMLIGGTEVDEVRTDRPYELSCYNRAIDGISYLIVSVRIFADKMGPTFLVVTGTIDAKIDLKLSPAVQRSGTSSEFVFIRNYSIPPQ
jgi:hypothetical protein